MGGGVALRINTTAAAADTDNPRTGRKLIERERESHRDTDTASEVHARYVSHPTSRVAAVDVLQNIHCLTENTFNLHTRPNTGLKTCLWCGLCMLNDGPEDPASTLLPQPEALLMSCELTSPSCRKAEPQEPCPYGLRCHRSTSASVGTCESRLA